MDNKYYFSSFSNYAKDGISESIAKLNSDKKNLTIVCIGSDLVLGDSLGPLVGTFLKKQNLPVYIYGTLNLPITAKEVDYANTYIKEMHPNSIVVAIDAAMGKEDDVGLIKVTDDGIKPGLGVNKNLEKIGDLSIIGIVATKSNKNYNLFNLTRLNLVYKMAEQISSGICDYVKNNNLIA